MEWGSFIYFVDQHASHELLIFNRLEDSPPARQASLIPLAFETDGEEEDAFLEEAAQALAAGGYRFARGEGDRSWKLESWPAGLEAGEIPRAILSLRGRNDLLRALRAMTACKAAVKDGDALDPAAMEEIASFALTTDEPRCPHGRPLYWRLSKDELFRSVGRIVR